MKLPQSSSCCLLTCLLLLLWAPSLFARERKKVADLYEDESSFFGGMESPFSRALFERNVESALNRVREILHEEKQVELAEHQEHTYADKFALVELVTRTTETMLLEAFGTKGLGMSDISSKGAATIMNMETSSSVEFLYEKENKVVREGKETVDDLGNVMKEERNVQYSKQYHWNITAFYDLYICRNLDNACINEEKQSLRSRSASSTLTTASKTPPRKEKVHQIMTLNLTRWMQQIENQQPFIIDRDAPDCKTPSRNPDMEKVSYRFRKVYDWCQVVLKDLFELYGKPLVPDHLKSEVPILALPLLENSTMPSSDIITQLVAEQNRLFVKSMQQIEETMPKPEPGFLISSEELKLYQTLMHVKRLILIYSESVAYIEELLRRQLTRAVGKEVSASDFSQYMLFHNRKVFGSEYLPTPFSHAIRRPSQYPVGLIAIENSESSSEPIATFTRRISGNDANPIRIPIDAATTVEITGDRVLSGWIRYEFASEAPSDIVLAARARQFSSFLLFIGTMTGPDSFDPTYGIILKNKDEVRIFLESQVLPSAKEFKDSISSLSPEQQEFARAFRSMQLESSVFALCVIQLKPQLERLLNLPEGALSKEIELTENLTTLFVDFQIPSDLLSYDGPSSAAMSEKVNVVKSYVGSVMSVIESNKEKQLQEEKRKAEARKSMFAAHARQHMPDEDWSEYEEAGFEPSALYSAFTQTSGHFQYYSNEVDDAYEEADYEEEADYQEEAKRHVRRPTDPPQTRARDESEIPDSDDAKSKSKKSSVSRDSSSEDFTMIPKILDEKLERHDTDGALRSMIIKAGTSWQRMRQENLLSEPVETFLSSDEIDREKKAAFDLLDAISRSGTLPIASSELHVVVGVAHCFDKSLMATVVEDNVNPILKAERSLLMVASTIHNEAVQSLIGDRAQTQRLSSAFPALFDVPFIIDTSEQ